jgi:hypothetical protein
LFKENINPRTHIRSVRRFWQRGRRGYDETTWWSLDYAMADLLVHNLPKLMEKSIGVSMQFFEEDDWDATTDHWKRGAVGRATARRNRVYQSILDGMKIFVEDGYPFTKEDQKKVDKSLKLLHQYFFTLWD